jgi:hypothetical protein
MSATLLRGLPPQAAPDCRVLVLGSMPGAASLAAARYYAHPRNRFWPLMGALCGFDPALDYPLRLAALQAAGVGLWDVIGTCERRGSLDADIVRGSEVANPLVDGESGVSGVYLGVEAQIGRDGIKKVVEDKLTDTEIAGLKEAADAVGAKQAYVPNL